MLLIVYRFSFFTANRIEANYAKNHLDTYSAAEHLRAPVEIAAYFEACIEEANCDAAFIAEAEHAEKSTSWKPLGMAAERSH